MYFLDWREEKTYSLNLGRPTFAGVSNWIPESLDVATLGEDSDTCHEIDNECFCDKKV